MALYSWDALFMKLYSLDALLNNSPPLQLPPSRVPSLEARTLEYWSLIVLDTDNIQLYPYNEQHRETARPTQLAYPALPIQNTMDLHVDYLTSIYIRLGVIQS